MNRHADARRTALDHGHGNAIVNRIKAKLNAEVSGRALPCSAGCEVAAMSVMDLKPNIRNKLARGKSQRCF